MLTLREQVHSTARRVWEEYLRSGYLPVDFRLWYAGRARQPSYRIDRASDMHIPRRDLAFEDFRLWAVDFLQHQDQKVAA